jgi:hypothetical protein
MSDEGNSLVSTVDGFMGSEVSSFAPALSLNWTGAYTDVFDTKTAAVDENSLDDG